MKRMKRLLAAVLTVLLLLNATGAAFAAVIPDDHGIGARIRPMDPATMTTYRKVVQDVVNAYGIYEETGEWFETYGQTGVAGLCLADLTGDGTDELIICVVGENAEEPTAMYVHIYSYDGGTLTQIYSESVGVNFVVARNSDGREFLVLGYTHSDFTPYVWGGSEFVTGELTEADYEQIGEASQEGGIIAEGDVRSKLLFKRLNLNWDESVTLFEASTYVGPETSGDVYTSLNALGVTVPVDLVDLLDDLAYIGDKSACKMTAQMARAYAQVIESMPEKHPENSKYLLYAALVDVANDGYPILITAYLDKTAAGYSECDREWLGDLGYSKYVTFWGYRNGAAYDAGVTDLNYSNYFGMINGKGAIYIRELVHFVGARRDTMVYTVSKGEIRLEYTLEEYDAEYSAGSETAWGQAPDGADYLVGEDLLDVSKLSENGWMLWDDIWNLYILNGKVATGDLIGTNFDTYIGFHYGEEFAHINDMENHINISTVAAADAVAALRTYANSSSAYSYPKAEEVDDAVIVDAIAKTVAEAVGGEVSAIYKLADGVYYVVITVNGSEMAALVKGEKQNGEVVWIVSEKHDVPLPEEELAAKLGQILSHSNIELDYNTLIGSGGPDPIDELQRVLDNMPGLHPNDAAKSEIADYIQSAISAAGSGSVSGADNRLELNETAIGGLVGKAREAEDRFSELLNSNGVVLNRSLTIVIRILWQDMDSGVPCQVTLNQALLDALEGYDIQILLGDARHYLQLSNVKLQEMISTYGEVNVQIAMESDGSYTVNFVTEDGELINRLEVHVTIALPAETELGTIMVYYSGGNANWGGQYDGNNGVISFDAVYSGRYEVLENSVQINDIGQLDEQVRQAIAFLVSKGYMDIEDGMFRPEANLTRYEFSRAIVGMFFALDSGLTTGFPDVPADSDYYAYVASGEALHLLKGFDDGTFGGDLNITIEQMLAMAARTLIESKGYVEPADAQIHLSLFADGADVSDWASSQVALAIREGLVDPSGRLTPGKDVTRAEAALILYRLFLLLHEVPPVSLELPESDMSEGSDIVEDVVVPAEGEKTIPDLSVIVVAALIGCAVVSCGAVALVLVGKRKKQ